MGVAYIKNPKLIYHIELKSQKSEISCTPK